MPFLLKPSTRDDRPGYSAYELHSSRSGARLRSEIQIERYVAPLITEQLGVMGDYWTQVGRWFMYVERVREEVKPAHTVVRASGDIGLVYTAGTQHVSFFRVWVYLQTDDDQFPVQFQLSESMDD